MCTGVKGSVQCISAATSLSSKMEAEEGTAIRLLMQHRHQKAPELVLASVEAAPALGDCPPGVGGAGGGQPHEGVTPVADLGLPELPAIQDGRIWQTA